MISKKILVINPGSTSTKIAVYYGENSVFLKNIHHEIEDLEKHTSVDKQFKFRKDLIISEITNAGFKISELDLIIARGGLLKPIESGIYEVNDAMIDDLLNSTRYHASNLGALIANEISKTKSELKSYIADPVVVDEMQDIARYSGHPSFERVSIFHALNQKAIARSYALAQGKNYEELNLVVVHMGGGISVGAHKNGKVIDVNQALDGEGPFSPERSGTLPIGDVIKMAFNGKHTQGEMLKMVVGKGGMTAYMGTNDAHKIEIDALSGNKDAEMIYKAMAYQVAKEIGAMATVLQGKVDAIILTGGLAKSDYLNDSIKENVSFISNVVVFAGEDEMKSLAMNGNLLLKGEINNKVYR
ncbi:butyrate kinase [Flavicella sp.]|uniref:butyrate kinase n=1 Tax=Flavicella sp. TaxID=2957742 RepID=UPI00301B456F